MYCPSLVGAVALGGIILAQSAPEPGQDPQFFETHVIDAKFSQGYQVSAADVNADGDTDILALSTTPSQLVWYRNPDWARFTITTRTERNIDFAPHDIDGDGDIDIALASAFDLGDSTTGGLVHWLERPDDPVQNQEWAIHFIDAIPTSHRLRWAELTPDGVKELVNLPIIGIGAQAPEYGVGVQFVSYAVPKCPTDPWTKIVVDNTLTVAHGLAPAQWDDDLRDELLTASAEGVHLFDFKENEAAKVLLGQGHQAQAPNRGASEVAVGQFGLHKQRFIATIEPWHGNEVVVYRPDADLPDPWVRTVIDDSLQDGHALASYDIDNDEVSEIIAGQRRGNHSLYLYIYEAGSDGWNRFTIDEGGMAAAGIAVVDLDMDARADIVVIGTATNNIVWYRNITPR